MRCHFTLHTFFLYHFLTGRDLDHHAAIAGTPGCSYGTGRRIINVVNPFYATLLPRFDPPEEGFIFLWEGILSLRSIIVTVHLQRTLHTIPAVQLPKPEEGSSSVRVVNTEVQKSNIVAVSVCPGISRVDTISALFNGWTIRSTSFGIVL